MNEHHESREFNRWAENFQKHIGYQFSRPELLRLAFVQRSSEESQAPSRNNERLEFLGDAAIGLIVGAALYGEYPEADEGFMTIERSKLVCGQNLSAWGYEAGFDRMISAGEGVQITAAMVEDSVEAVAGALFLDGGLSAVKGFLQSFSDYPDQGAGFDARRHLARVCVLEKLGAPKFKTTRRWANGGRIFETTVTLDGKEAGTGLAGDQVTAERNAARDTLARLDRVSAQEQQKRAAIQRAHFRRVLSGRVKAARGKSPVTLSEAEERKKSLEAAVQESAAVQAEERRKLPAPTDVEGLMKSVESALAASVAALPVVPGVPAPVAAGEQSKASATVPSVVKQQAKALVAAPAKPEAQKKSSVPAPVKAEEQKKTLAASTAAAPAKTAKSAFVGLDLAALRESPDIKGALQTICKRLHLGQLNYVDLPMPQKKGKEQQFSVGVKVGGELVAAGCAPSKKAAGKMAAWKAIQLLAAGEPGGMADPAAELDALSAGLEEILNAGLPGERRMKCAFTSRPERPLPVNCLLTSGGKPLTQVPGATEAQARLHAAAKIVTKRGLWPEALARMGVAGTLPDLALAQWQKENPRQAVVWSALRCGGSDAAQLYRVGAFVGGELAAWAVGSDKEMTETLLSLLLLDRAAHGRPLAPQSIEPGPSGTPPAQPPQAEQKSAVNNTPAPAGKQLQQPQAVRRTESAQNVAAHAKKQPPKPQAAQPAESAQTVPAPAMPADKRTKQNEAAQDIGAPVHEAGQQPDVLQNVAAPAVNRAQRPEPAQKAADPADKAAQPKKPAQDAAIPARPTLKKRLTDWLRRKADDYVNS